MSQVSVRCRVYIGRLSSRATEREVDRFFKGFGRIVDMQLKNGYGFVEFADPRDADDAVHDLNGKDLCGERVSIEHARSGPRGMPSDWPRGRDHGGGGGYDHGRSRNDYSSRRRSRSRSRSRGRRRRSRSRSRSRRSRSHSRSRRHHRRRDSRSRSRSVSRGRSRSRSRSKSRSRSRSRSVSSRSRSRSKSKSSRRSRSRSPARMDNDDINDTDIGSQSVRTNWRVEVTNLPAGLSSLELKDHMALGGEVAFSHVDGHSGFVEYCEKESIVMAINKLDKSILKGAEISVTESIPVSDNNGNKNNHHENGQKPSRSRSGSVGSNDKRAGGDANVSTTLHSDASNGNA